MKAAEVLRRYAAGERNFRGANLRGQSFKRENLAGADFRDADIRSTNFTKATLTGANFRGAEAGLQRRWQICLTVFALLLSVVSGIFCWFPAFFVGLIFDSDPTNTVVGWVGLGVMAIFWIVVIRKGINAVGGAFAVAVAGAVAVAFAFALLGAYISWRALAGDEKYALVRIAAVAFAAIGGTSFRYANLTDADFTGATLKSTDCRGATLTRTCWHKTQKLDRIRPGNSILAQPALRELLRTGYGYKKPLARANLQGVNLNGANLNLANLRGANLNDATLRHANLEGAILTQAQSIGTDFTHAYFTGACLEAWSIDATTKLEQANCRFVYLLEHPDPKTGSRERRPHDADAVFAPGDFEKLYTKIMNTVQILLRNGINPEAFHTAFQQLMEEHPDITPDSIQGVEKKGKDVLVTLEVSEDTDKGAVEHQFLEVYQAKLEAQKQAALLEAETRHSQEIKELALVVSKNNSLSGFIFNLTNTVTAENKAMNNSSDNSQNINVGGDVTGSTLNIGEISGTVSNAINQLPSSPAPEQPGIKELLAQLQAAIEAEPDLDNEEKAEALEQVKTLAEAGQNPQEGSKQKLAKRATTMLKGIVSGLPDAAKLAGEVNKLLPAIAKIFGL